MIEIDSYLAEGARMVDACPKKDFILCHGTDTVGDQIEV